MLVYSVCPHGKDWRPLSGAASKDVHFIESPAKPSWGPQESEVGQVDLVELFLQWHARTMPSLLAGLMPRLDPVDENQSLALRAELTASTNHGALASQALVGFAVPGARAGYTRERLGPRSRQLGAMLLAEPALQKLCSGGQLPAKSTSLRVASLGGGPGETALAMLLVRAVLNGSLNASCPPSMELEIAVLDIEPGWSSCVQGVSAELAAKGLLFPCDHVWFGCADITQNLESESNKSLHSSEAWDIVVFSFVLVENAVALQTNQYIFLHDLFGKLCHGSCCLILDSSRKLHEQIISIGQEHGLEQKGLDLSSSLSGNKPSNCLLLFK